MNSSKLKKKLKKERLESLTDRLNFATVESLKNMNCVSSVGSSSASHSRTSRPCPNFREKRLPQLMLGSLSNHDERDDDDVKQSRRTKTTTWELFFILASSV